MSKRKRHQADQRADLKGAGFIGLPVAVHRSDAYRTLPLFERAVLIEILATFNGYNNGALVISQRQISDALGNTNFGKIGRAIARLIEHGLLDISTEGVWKQRRAREYRLTFIQSGTAPNIRHATNEYLLHRKIDADDASAGKGKSADDVSASPNSAADDVSASPPRKPQKFVGRFKSAADDASSLICKPYQGEEISPVIPDENTGGDPNGFFIERLTAFWQSADRTSRKNLAESCGLLPADLQAAMRNADVIAASKRAALLCEIRRQG